MVREIYGLGFRAEGLGYASLIIYVLFYECIHAHIFCVDVHREREKERENNEQYE
jgi:hypothetical protein